MPKKTKTETQDVITGQVVVEEETLSLEALCENCGLTPQTITTYIQEGLIEGQSGAPERWTFSRLTMIRIRKAARLEQDLRLNPAGAVLALELMDEIEALRNRLKQYE